MSDELARARAREWYASVRAKITTDGPHAAWSALRVQQGAGHGEDRGYANILAVAHALSEVWLSGEQVTARAVADHLGWHAEHSALAVEVWLRPLQTGHPPLVREDLRPHIQLQEPANGKLMGQGQDAG